MDRQGVHMRLITMLIVAASFLTGILAGSAIGHDTTIDSEGFEFPLPPTGSAIERASPGDHVQESQIRVYKDRVVLDLQDVIYASFSDTNSMDPLFDEHANAIEIVPKSEAQIQEGDIVAYTNGCTDGSTIIHRVIKTNQDELGTYYLVKGDNNRDVDPCKVRFSEIKSVVAAIIY